MVFLVKGFRFFCVGLEKIKFNWQFVVLGAVGLLDLDFFLDYVLLCLRFLVYYGFYKKYLSCCVFYYFYYFEILVSLDYYLNLSIQIEFKEYEEMC